MAGPEPELLLDPGIRLWVVLPVVLITFLVGVSRHYLGLLLQAERKPGLRQLGHSQFLIRSRALREHGKYIPRQSFVMRKHFFNDAESGFFRKTKTKILPKNPITDPSMLTEMMKGNVTHVLSMLIVGGWINSTFSGFVISNVPRAQGGWGFLCREGEECLCKAGLCRDKHGDIPAGGDRRIQWGRSENLWERGERRWEGSTEEQRGFGEILPSRGEVWCAGTGGC
ncbi:ER membrane protein complex subunit 3-like [Hypanus sabinus]|uniref:ER membrane protein complex subunit 3-like n=1 Tax=Hypanus sabinus TaxID=79690 RepID=UPI0028C49FB8|nr:ER membrane protein complex subunit 3-like [Hypanus sabinus]